MHDIMNTDLTQHESMDWSRRPPGGHTLERHVNKTDAWLKRRFNLDDISASGAFCYDQAFAEALIAKALLANLAEVFEWQESHRTSGGSAGDEAPDKDLVLEYTNNFPVGRYFRRDASPTAPPTETYTLKIILLWVDAGETIHGRDNYIMTAYPL
ncbi:hypothetical protein CYR52_05070 [Chimaeribacter arupi]|nr:hypothetical protein CYR52_05070 [Chimaeribacter arupi]